MRVTRTKIPSPLPFGVLPPRLGEGHSLSGRSVSCVSIAFRRSAPPAPDKRTKQRNNGESPLPFGVLPPRLKADSSLTASASHTVSIAFRRSAPPAQHRAFFEPHFSGNGLHCLSAFCPPGSTRKFGEWCNSPLCLHCLSAFCPPGSICRKTHWEKASEESPLPFGVLPPRLGITRHQRLKHDRRVSIAFRRSAPPALAEIQPAEVCRYMGLHCLSAFCPPGSGRRRGAGVVRAARLHCLSAFCPPGSICLERKPEDDADEVSIAFRRSAPPARYRALLCPSHSRRSPLPFGVLPPRLMRTDSITNPTAAGLHCLLAFCPPGSPASKLLGWPRPRGHPGHDCRREPIWLVRAVGLLRG